MDKDSGGKIYKKITLYGLIQGVGFRPFVLRLADRLGIFGQVRNQGGAVVISACGDPDSMRLFLIGLADGVPVGAIVVNIVSEVLPEFDASEFSISDSTNEINRGCVFVPPDIGICPDCLREISDTGDRRKGHPFNSCISCGARFSIISHLPYDRVNTAMERFPLCEKCGAEYTLPYDRRCHAQTVCCNECGPELSLRYKNGTVINAGEAVNKTAELLLDGKIVAIKGMGGYHFACSPYSAEAVSVLRKLKGRDSKPFAVMYGDIKAVGQVCVVGRNEEKALLSPARPIVLLDVKEDIFTSEALRGDSRCGCFLPYTALHSMLIKLTGELVLTSANPSGGAIIYSDTEMERFFDACDHILFAAVLSNDREILRPVEDSVVQVIAGSKAVTMTGDTQILRRSRGYTPLPFVIENRSGDDFVALGGDLKAAFCTVKDEYAYQSQYFGDLGEKSVNDRYRDGLNDFTSLFNIKPRSIVCDAHPAYFSSQIADQMELPVLRVQHHHAHIASVMAEHNLGGKVIGTVFDGTGYGSDGCVWGGEFLVCEEAAFRRAGHLDYTPLLGGDSAAYDAKKTAYSFLHGIGVDDLEQFDPRDRVLSAAIAGGVNICNSSSMGRVFDAVSAILGLSGYNTYEGECAVLLQRQAEKAFRMGIQHYPMRFGIDVNENCFTVRATELIHEIYRVRHRICPEALALGFHVAVSDLVEDICTRLADIEKSSTVALSGGVFQNRLLLELSVTKLVNGKIDVFYNCLSSPNDGGISLGQAYIKGKT